MSAPEPLRVVRASGETWRDYRATRLACLIDSPQFFGTTYAAAARLTDEDWRERVSAPHLAFWLALQGERPVGTAGLWVDDDLGGGVLIGMWVAPPERGGGAAERLVAEVGAEAERRGCARLVLHVDARNQRAIGFYARQGFHQVGEVSGVDGARDELIMEQVPWPSAPRG